MGRRWLFVSLGGCAVAVACGSFSETDKPGETPLDASVLADVTVDDAQVAEGGGDAATSCSIVSLDTGDQHTCAVKADGKVWCWGINSAGQLGIGNNATLVPRPTQVIDVVDAVEVSAGPYHSCARTRSGELWCWGANNAGQIGIGSVTVVGVPPTKVSIVTDAKSISVGFAHTCAVRSDDSVWCWGANQYGQVGNGAASATAVSSPTKVAKVTNAKSVGAGGFHTCSLGKNGGVWCWGANNVGQLGHGLEDAGADAQIIPHATPVQATAELSSDLASGFAHACATTASGLVCWGANNTRQLGSADTADPIGVPTKVVVPANLSLMAPDLGPQATCALASDGTGPWCWGMNELGILNQTTSGATPIPTKIVTTGESVHVGAGHACVRMKDGPPRCWGTSRFGQLGRGTVDPDGGEPVRVGPAPVIGLCD